MQPVRMGIKPALGLLGWLALLLFTTMVESSAQHPARDRTHDAIVLAGSN